MVFNNITLSVLLEALRLTQGSSKPSSAALTTIDIHNATNVSRPSPSITPTAGSLGVNNAPPVMMVLDESGRSPVAAPGNLCNVEPYTEPAPMETFTLFNQSLASIYRYRQQQSVNLGSWFVHEDWMTPSLFTCASGHKASELDIAMGWGSLGSARSLLERHWDTWITQSDFQYLADIGINTVRLPIGYWSLGPYYCQDTPFSDVAEVYQNSWSRVVRAINMAESAGIGVLIDLHGAVGSQNGQSHSGISDGATNLFNDPLNMDKTIGVLVFLAQQLASVTSVVGIQMLNEPKDVPELTDFYTRAITSMREVSPNAASLPLYLHNAFNLNRFSDYVANRTDFVVQDHHSYFVFTPSDENEPASQHTSDVQGNISDALGGASVEQHRNLIIGEWSCALTDQSLSNEPDKDRARKDFCTGQMDVYTNTTAGWSFWSYLKEGCEDDPGWCFKAAVNRSLPATFFSYGQPVTDPWQIQYLAGTIANMTVPSTSNILAKPLITSTLGVSPPAGRRDALSSGSQSRLYHRFEAVHFRRHWKRDTFDGLALTGNQRSTTQGYSDGFLAAKTFASFNTSKLGFIGQYIADSIVHLGPSIIAPGTEGSYHSGFMAGLQDGQEVIMSVVNPPL